MKVRSSDPAISAHAHAQALITGEGVVLHPGRKHVFTDANAAGGIGIIVVEGMADGAAASPWPPTNVYEVLGGAGLAGLATRTQIRRALAEQRNILAEMTALLAVVRSQLERGEFTLVFDYWGVERWIQGSWRGAKHPATVAVIKACKDVIDEGGGARIEFKYQVAHQRTIIGRDDYAYWNGRADELASQGAVK